MSASHSASLKQQADELIDQLPDTTSWDDIVDKLRYRRELAAGIAEADAGQYAAPADVTAASRLPKQRRHERVDSLHH